MDEISTLKSEDENMEIIDIKQEVSEDENILNDCDDLDDEAFNFTRGANDTRVEEKHGEEFANGDKDRLLVLWSIHDTFAKNVPDGLILKYLDQHLSHGIFTIKVCLNVIISLSIVFSLVLFIFLVIVVVVVVASIVLEALVAVKVVVFLVIHLFQSQPPKGFPKGTVFGPYHGELTNERGRDGRDKDFLGWSVSCTLSKYS